MFAFFSCLPFPPPQHLLSNRQPIPGVCFVNTSNAHPFRHPSLGADLLLTRIGEKQDEYWRSTDAKEFIAASIVNGPDLASLHTLAHFQGYSGSCVSCVRVFLFMAFASLIGRLSPKHKIEMPSHGWHVGSVNCSLLHQPQRPRLTIQEQFRTL